MRRRFPPGVPSTPVQTIIEEELLGYYELMHSIPLPCRIELQDYIYISSVSWLSTTSFIFVYYRVLQPDGNISSGVWQSPTRNNDSTELVTIIQPNIEGTIISLSAKLSTLGTCYCQIGIHRGSTTSSGYRLNTLIAGYLRNNRSLSYPDDKPITAVQGSGEILVIGAFSGALPYSITPPPYIRWRNPIIKISFATDATVGNRQVRLRVRSSASLDLGYFVSQVNQAASLTYEYTFAQHAGSSSVLGSGTDWYVNVQFPDNFITPLGGSIVFDPINFQAGDTFTCRLYAEEVAYI